MKTMIITGTSRGIGRHLANHYCMLGWKVIGCSRSPGTIDESNYYHFEMDITSESDVRSMFNTLNENDDFQVLINNAGIASMNHSLLMPIETAKNILNTNVIGTFLMSREFAKCNLTSQNRRIVNFASFAVPLKLEGEAIYAASKAAIISLTQIMAKEFSNQCLTVNAVSPPAVLTDMIKGVPEKKMQAIFERLSIKRYGAPNEVARVIDFIIDQDSAMLNGQVIYMGGV